MADDEKKKLEEEKKRKQQEIERKRAEVRARMEEASKAKKAKKGFMTPERKKKLRLLLRKKAAEELKKEQERKAAERRRIIEERCGKPKLVDDSNEATVKQICEAYHKRIAELENRKFDLEKEVEGRDFQGAVMEWHFILRKSNQKIIRHRQLKKICKDYYDRMYICEEQKWDLEREVRRRDWEISDLNSQVNDLRGKFVKPPLKKVSKYENKFAKLQKKAAEFNFRNQLKVVKKKEFTLEEEDKENAQKAATAAKKKPDWSKKGDEKKEGEEAEAAPPADSAPPAEGAAPSEGQPPTEGQPPSEDKPPAEGQPPTEGQPGEQPTDGAPATEGVSTAEGTTPAEGTPGTEEQPAEEPPAGGFESFKNLVINENYDIIALPETILAPTEDKDTVAIPHYSLVENRRNSGDGVLLYIKDSLKYKVVDLRSDDPDDHLSFEDLLDKLKKNGHVSSEDEQLAKGTPDAEGEGAPAATDGAPAPTEGEASVAAEGAPAEGAPAEGAPAEGAPATTETVPTEGAQAAEETTKSTEETPAATNEPAAVTEQPASESAPAATEHKESLPETSPAIASPPIIEAAA